LAAPPALDLPGAGTPDISRVDIGKVRVRRATHSQERVQTSGRPAINTSMSLGSGDGVRDSVKGDYHGLRQSDFGALRSTEKSLCARRPRPECVAPIFRSSPSQETPD